MNNTHSTYFSTLYEEPYPVGQLGQGTCYSIMRAVEWLDECRIMLKKPKAHDFGIIWQHPREERTIQIVETLFMNELFSPVLFIAVRGHAVSLLVNSNFRSACDGAEFETYVSEINAALKACEGGPWTVELGVFDISPGWPRHQADLADIIPATKYRASTYLRNIDNLWQLGLKLFSPTPISYAIY